MPLYLPPPPQPVIIATEVSALAGVATDTLTALQVYVYVFELAVATTFSGAKWRINTAASPGSTDIGIYNFAGTTLFASLGGVVNVANTSFAQAFSGGNVTLQPGQYCTALASENNSDNYTGINAPAASAVILSRYRYAANGSVNAHPTTLPSTLGALSNPSTTKMPAWSLTVVGGI